ncbi:GNAT family N-acetyltransferase [Streptomyces sp. NPDC093252]|uniref:GNAT family N-acetyltransferase n=1 Tax=Streptomyces sp. NPDC093252 TaxID=3154980 RepID=UPI00344038E0
MGLDAWHTAEGIDHFLARTGDFLRSRPGMHTTALTVTEKMRVEGDEGASLGWLERDGEVRGIYYRVSPERGVSLTPLAPEDTEGLAEHLLGLGRPLPYVTAERATARAFTEAWGRRTGAAADIRVELGLYRLGTLTPPDPFPEGSARPAGDADHEHVMQWCRELAAYFGEEVTINAETWASTRFGEKTYLYWVDPDGVPVSMAGANPLIGGQVRVDPVYTPEHLRGRSYGGAATVAVSRAALDAGAEEVVLYTNLANPTSNALYQRLGYRSIAEFAVYDFA